MNSVQIHLALTHVPVILTLAALVLLIVSYIRKNETLTKTAYSGFIIAALLTLPVYFTGESTEELVEKLPGVTEPVIERHEEVAQFALFAVSITGIAALIGLLFSRLLQKTKIVKVLTLLMALTAGGLMVQTAHLGGQIRHSEIRPGAVVQNDNATIRDQAQHDADD